MKLITAIIFIVSAIFVTIFLVGFEEEQVLYSYESEERIPDVPEFATGLRDGIMDERPELFQAGGDVFDLSAPTPIEFPDVGLAERTEKYTIVGLHVPLPVRYLSLTPASSMRVAEFQVPNRSGGASGSLVAFHFGENQGGDLMGNAGRWHSQFSKPDGSETIVRFHQQKRPDLDVARLTLEGTWTQGMMPGAATTPEPLEGWAMDAVVIEGGPEGTLFMRLTGPADLVRAEADVMTQLAREVHLLSSHEEEHDHSTHGGSALVAGAPVGTSVHSVAMLIPEGWEVMEPEGAMRSAQFRIPGATPDMNAEVVAFYFGPSGGGTVEANLDRWAGQVSGGNPTKEVLTNEGVTLHTVRTTGTYAPSAMMSGGATTPQRNTTLLGVVIEGGTEGPLYLRLTGPEATFIEQQERIDQFLKSIRPE